MRNYLLGEASDYTESQIDKGAYSEEQLIELKVSLNMPYYQNTEFQRQSGSVVINGITYSYVEKRILNGYLILKCLPDMKSQQVKERTGNYFAGANGFESSRKNGHSDGKSSWKFKVVDYEENLLHSNRFRLIISADKLFSLHQFFSNYLLINAPEQPPELFSC